MVLILLYLWSNFFSQVEATDSFHKGIKIDAGRKNDRYRKALEQFHRSLPILFRQAIGDSSCEYHEKLVTRLSSKDVILSFNYDCLIETALQKEVKSRWNPGEGYGFTAHGNVKSWPSRKGITLLKPHGSLNWNIDAGAKVTTLEAKPYDISTAKGRIIPPTWFKNIEKYPYEDVWKRARREIRECTALIVIGYSIPPTDLFSRILFRIDIKTIEFLVIANPNFSHRQKFLDLINDKMAKNARIVEFDNLEKLAKSLSP